MEPSKINNIAPEGDALYNFSDNTKYRGTWDAWLRDTVMSTEEWHRKAVAHSIMNFTKGAKCMTCRTHAAAYVSSHDPHKATESMKNMFMYLVTFMNAIQTRKQKKLYDPDILYRVFSQGSLGVCEENCDGKEALQEKNTFQEERQKLVVRTPVQNPNKQAMYLYPSRTNGRFIVRPTNVK